MAMKQVVPSVSCHGVIIEMAGSISGKASDMEPVLADFHGFLLILCSMLKPSLVE